MLFSKSRIFLSVVLFMIFCLLQGCDPGEPGTWQNDQIEGGQRADFHKLNDQLFSLCKANKPSQLQDMMSAEMLGGNLSYTNRQINLISIRCKADAYNVLDEFYIKSVKPGPFSVKSTKYKYILNYQAVTEDVYIALLILKGNEEKWLVTAIYNKFNYGWRLSKLDLSQYTVNGNTAPELFTMAKKKYSQNYLTDAVNIMSEANQCQRPNDYWTYADDYEMSKFYSQIAHEANEKYKFPMTLQQMQSKPQVFRVFNQTMPGGVFPKIYYLSKINLKDTVAIKKENDELQKVIGQVLPGVDKDKKYLFFSAFNELPTGKKTVDYFDMVERLP